MDLERAKMGGYSPEGVQSPEEVARIESANKQRMEAEAEKGLELLARTAEEDPELVRALLKRELMGIEDEDVDRLLSAFGGKSKSEEVFH